MDQNQQNTQVTPPPAPTQEWQATPPEAAKVQYVVNQKSLDGVGGWLMVWVVFFALNGLGYLSFFANAAEDASQYTALDYVMWPILAGLSFASVAFISMRKKMGAMIALATIAVATLYNVLNALLSGGDGEKMSVALVGAVMQLAIGGLFALYFFTSKRVKATLRNK